MKKFINFLVDHYYGLSDYILSRCSSETQNRYYRVRYQIGQFFLRVFYKPIYYSYFSRDCDMCESSYVSEFLGSRKSYEEMKMRSYEGAEGPMSFTEISREEYEELKGQRYFRDRVMENYENGGNGYLV